MMIFDWVRICDRIGHARDVTRPACDRALPTPTISLYHHLIGTYSLGCVAYPLSIILTCKAFPICRNTVMIQSKRMCIIMFDYAYSI